MAGAIRSPLGVEGRGDPPAASRGRGAASSQPKTPTAMDR